MLNNRNTWNKIFLNEALQNKVEKQWKTTQLAVGT